jgi:WD40 repeat protein
LLRDIPAHNYHINDIKFNPSASLFATVSMDKTLKIWDSETLKLLKVVDRFKQDAHTNSVNKIIWLNENELITCGDDKLIFQWEIIED